MTTTLRSLTAILGLFALFCTPDFARAASTAEGPHVNVALVSEDAQVTAGEAFWVGLKFEVEHHWHIYWQNPGDSGQAPTVKWTLPEGVTADSISWPRPTRIDLAPLANYGYEGETLLPIRMQAAAGAQGDLALSGDVRWLVCAEICIPGKAHLDLKVPVAKARKVGKEAATFERTRHELPQPLPGTWQFTGNGGDHPTLFVQTGSDVSIAQFFPREGEKLEQAADQKFEASKDGFKLTLVRNEQLNTLENLDGLLVVVSKTGTQSYMVNVPLDGERLKAEKVAGLTQMTASGSASAGATGGDPALAAPPVDANPGNSAPMNAAGANGHGDGTDLATGKEAAEAGGGRAGIDSGPPVAQDAPPMWSVLMLAFLGGLVLNLMPCVFPVLSLKVMSFIQASHQDKREVRMHALAYTLGILVSFWILVGALLALRYSGEQLGWGFQLQSPGFVVAVSSLLFGFGLNLLGIFEVGGTWMGAGQHLASRGGLGGAFFTGVLAVIVATPCTAPFMGSAVGFALGQPAPIAFVVFTALALGLAAPYIVLSYIPNLGRLLPRPGNWMVTLREGMAFILFATVIWLAWVLGLEGGLSAVTFLLVDFLFLGIAAWVLHRWVGKTPALVVAMVLGITGVGIGVSQSHDALPPVAVSAGAAGSNAQPAAGGRNTAGGANVVGGAGPKATGADGLTWEAWTPDTLARYRKSGRPIFVDFTAAWCLSCKVNERLVFGSANVRTKLHDMDIVLLKADWTNQDPAITQVLSTFGRSGVPLYIVYPKDPSADPIVLPEVITPGIVLDALAQVHP